MPPDRLPPDDPREWLNRARSDLTLAGVHEANVYLEDLCFHAQQAAEKAIKGLMIHRQVRSARLTRFALADRYPGVGGLVTEEEHQEFLQIAHEVVRWAREQVEEPGAQ